MHKSFNICWAHNKVYSLYIRIETLIWYTNGEWIKWWPRNDVLIQVCVQLLENHLVLILTKVKDLFLERVEGFGKCQPVFSIAVSQHAYNNKPSSTIGRRSCEIISKEKHHCHTKVCAFRCLILRPQILNPRSRNQTRGKLILSRKLRHFRGSCFSQCYILPGFPITRYQVRFYAYNYFSIASKYQ